MGGILGAAIGFGGAYLLYGGGGDCADLCAVGLAIYAGVGAFIGLPVGVHLGNERRGYFLVDLFVSSAAGLAAYSWLKDVDPESLVLLVPVIQIATTLAAERGFGHD